MPNLTQSPESQHSDEPGEPAWPAPYTEDEEEEYDFSYVQMEVDFEGETFSEEQIRQIHECIQCVPLPTFIGRPPGNLGESSHGKLRAYDYLSLFTIIFPLTLPELWTGPAASKRDADLLVNFYHAVASTNIISAYSTSDEEADAYTAHYCNYL